MKRNIVFFALALLALTQFESCSKTAPAPSAKTTSVSTTVQSTRPALLPAPAESSRPAAGDSDKPGAYKIGDTGPAGGIVFYDKGNDEDGWRYLEAAPSDQSDGIQWYNGKDLNIMTFDEIGSGKANTEAIIAAQGYGDYAASLCKNLTINGFSDWFLPSTDELRLMYTNLKKAGLGGFGVGLFWSSSQNDEHGIYAWRQTFSNESLELSPSPLSDTYAVRACRAF